MSTTTYNNHNTRNAYIRKAISWQRPTTNIKSDMVCVKLISYSNYGMNANLVLLH